MFLGGLDTKTCTMEQFVFQSTLSFVTRVSYLSSKSRFGHLNRYRNSINASFVVDKILQELGIASYPNVHSIHIYCQIT